MCEKCQNLKNGDIIAVDNNGLCLECGRDVYVNWDIKQNNKMNIYKKLSDARKIIRESEVKKEGFNEYSKYSYFTPEQVEVLVTEACEKTGTLCLTSLDRDEFGYYQVLSFVDIEKPEEKITFKLRTERPEIKATNLTQQMGGMDTYSERYIKMKTFQIKDNSMDFDSQDNRVDKKVVDDVNFD